MRSVNLKENNIFYQQSIPSGASCKRTNEVLIICSIIFLLGACQSERIRAYNRSFHFLDKNGLEIAYEVEFRVKASSEFFKDEAKLKGVFTDPVRIVRREMAKYNCSDISILKRDSIEFDLQVNILRAKEQGEYDLQYFRFDNILLNEKIVDALKVKYGKLQRIKAMPTDKNIK